MPPPSRFFSACRTTTTTIYGALVSASAWHSSLAGRATQKSSFSVRNWTPLLTKSFPKRLKHGSCRVERHVNNQGAHTQLANAAARLRRSSATCAQSSAVSSASATMQSVRVTCTGDIANLVQTTQEDNVLRIRISYGEGISETKSGVQDALMEALLCFGAASCSIEDSNLGEPDEQKIYSDGPVPWQAGKRRLWNESRITALFPAGDDVGEALAMAADSVGLTEMPRYEVEDLEDRDWVQQVESQFKPIEVSQGLWIVPKWSSPPDAEALNVMIDPGLAFGTGEHPTTRLCLQWLHHVVSPGDRILDYGTGSGILSIAALKMGAASAVGVDIDPMAISSAEYNASLNKLAPHTLHVFVAPADGGDPVPKQYADFDVVAANILLNPLVELASRIAGYCKPGGLVGVSGILVDQVPQVKEAYAPYLDGMAVSHDNGWACVSGRKKTRPALSPPLAL